MKSTGYRSTGNWSTSNYSTGHFSTIDYSEFGAFNKPCSLETWQKAIKPTFLYFNLTEWVYTEDMTDQEKQNAPNYKTLHGYLKIYSYKEAWLKAWEEAAEKDKKLLYKLPNFDAEVFKKISGIDVTEEYKEMTLAQVKNKIAELLGYKIKIKGE